MIATCTHCGAPFQRDASEEWKRLCLPCWKRTKDRTAAPEAHRAAAPAPALDAARIRQLLQLCHPDRHGGSELAHAVTTWLLALKRQVTA